MADSSKCGAASQTLPVGTRPPTPIASAADTSFMQGMIMHHSQAVEMTDLLRTRTQTPDVQALGKRIGLSQTDEMKFMRHWLQSRGSANGCFGGLNTNDPAFSISGSAPIVAHGRSLRIGSACATGTQVYCA